MIYDYIYAIDLENNPGLWTKAAYNKEQMNVILIGPLKKNVSSRNTPGETATQHNAYELLQLKNDYAVCKQQKALLEEDLLDQRQEITELEKRIK